jgi:plastocyanin domain-containing protein
VKKNQKITWNVYGDEITGCTSAIIVPKLGLKFKVQKGLNTVTFTPTQAGTLNYSCWMGMVWGKIVVTE